MSRFKEEAAKSLRLGKRTVAAHYELLALIRAEDRTLAYKLLLLKPQSNSKAFIIADAMEWCVARQQQTNQTKDETIAACVKSGLFDVTEKQLADAWIRHFYRGVGPVIKYRRNKN